MTNQIDGCFHQIIWTKQALPTNLRPPCPRTENIGCECVWGGGLSNCTKAHACPHAHAIQSHLCLLCRVLGIVLLGPVANPDGESSGNDLWDRILATSFIVAGTSCWRPDAFFALIFVINILLPSSHSLNSRGGCFLVSVVS